MVVGRVRDAWRQTLWITSDLSVKASPEGPLHFVSLQTQVVVCVVNVIAFCIKELYINSVVLSAGGAF